MAASAKKHHIKSVLLGFEHVGRVCGSVPAFAQDTGVESVTVTGLSGQP